MGEVAANTAGVEPDDRHGPGSSIPIANQQQPPVPADAPHEKELPLAPHGDQQQQQRPSIDAAPQPAPLQRLSTPSSLVALHDKDDDQGAEGGCAGALNRFSAKLDVWSASVEASNARRRAEASRRKAQRRRRDLEDAEGSDFHEAGGNETGHDHAANGEPDPSKWAKPGYLKGDGVVKRKGMIPVVLVILSWVYLVYVWRICYPAIRQTSQATASRATGIGLLVGFNVIWIVTITSYARLIATGPGLVRDYAEESEPPMTPSETTPRVDQHGTSDSTAVGGDRDGVKLNDQAAEVRSQEGQEDDGLDPALPAFLGPMAAAAWAASEGAEAKPAPTAAEDHAELSDATHAPSPHVDFDADQTADSGVGATSATRSMRPVDPVAAPAERWSTSHRPSFHLLPEPTRRPEARHPLSAASRYCYRCRRMRPPRAHHCRRCGTCVLRMDHHCPWVGGCVGARNHKLFMHFLQWVTALELFVLVTDAILFSRGVQRVGSDRPWTVDGFMISLFPICAIFLLFTGALVGAHTYLFVFNLTTLEQMSVQRLRRGEDVALGQYFSKYGQGGEGWNLKGRKAVRGRWVEEWGSPKMEGNLFWIDRPLGQRFVDEGSNRADVEKTAGGAEGGGEGGRTWRKGNFWTGARANWNLVMGEKWWDWIVPITKGPMDGLVYPLNPRHDAAGNWRPRREWPEELR